MSLLVLFFCTSNHFINVKIQFNVPVCVSLLLKKIIKDEKTF